MLAALTVDGVALDASDDTPETVCLEFLAESAFRCRSCGDELFDTVAGLSPDSDDPGCPDSDLPDGSHDPERVPLSWCNSAAVHADESEDSVTVSISVGDPRGAFTFTIRRVPDDVDGDVAGRLLMHLPHAGQPASHLPMAQLHDGTYVIGSSCTTQDHV